MAEQDVIREFLVSVGYTVNESSQRKLRESMGRTTAEILKAAGAIATAMAAVTTAVDKVASGFDNLYWMAQRTGASVDSIKSLSYAVSQLGGSYAGSLGSIEAFGKALRTNPGYGSLVRSLGVRTEENGKLRDTVAIMKDLGQVLKNKPYYIAVQYANVLGLDENTFRALMSGELAKRQEEYVQKQKAVGLNTTSLADSSKRYEQAMRSLRGTIEVVADKVAEKLLPQFTKWIEKLDKWLLEHSDDIVKAVLAFADALAKLGDYIPKLIENLNPLWEWFDKIATALGGEDGKIVGAFKFFAAFLLGRWMVQILAAFTGVRTGWAAMLLGLGINPVTLGVAAAVYPTEANGNEDGRIAEQRRNGTFGKAPEVDQSQRDKRGWWEKQTWIPRFLGGNKPAPSSATSDVISGGGGSFKIVGGANRGADNIDPALMNIVRTAAERGGYNVELHSGFRPGDPRFHGQGKAVDIRLRDANGNLIGGAHGNYQDAATFRAYEKFAQDAKRVQMERYPALNDAFRWGGYFSGGKGRYGAMDGMHFDVGGPGMAGGSWEHGLTPEQRALFPGVVSQGMGRGWAGQRLQQAMAFNAARAGSGARMSDAFNASMTPWAGGGTAPLTLGGSNDNSRTWTLNQTTNINVTGGSDPSATAREVDKATAGTNAALLRNSQSAFR